MSDDVDTLLAAYRGELDDKIPRAERDWSRLEQKLDAEVEPLALSENKSRGRWVAWALGSLAALLLAAWGLAEASRWAMPEDSSRERAAADVVEAPPPSQAGAQQRVEQETERSEANFAPSAEPDPPPSHDPEADVVAQPEPPARKIKRAEPAAPKAQPKPTSSPVIAEAKSLRQVRAALRDGQGERALKLVRKHRRAFEGGTLRDEADLLEADALCTLGRRDEARRLADRLVERSPRSPLASRAGAMCKEP